MVFCMRQRHFGYFGEPPAKRKREYRKPVLKRREIASPVALCKFLVDKDGRIRHAAAESIVKMKRIPGWGFKEKQAVMIALEQSYNTPGTARQVALEAFLKFRFDSSPEIRLAVANSFADIGALPFWSNFVNEAVRSTLLRLMKDSDARVSEKAGLAHSQLFGKMRLI